MKAQFKASKEYPPIFYVALAIGIALLIATVAGYLSAFFYGVAAVCLFIVAFSFYFFRDPHREIPSDERTVVSPADGTVFGIEELASTPHYNGPCKRISIFLSVFNVHINRAPYDGTVESITYKRGQFRNAMGAATSELNEANTIRLNTPRGPMTVRQIAGMVARRIVCKVEVGETLGKGERFGMIKFGSRTELYLPMDAEICVTLKDKVKGGATVVARFP